MGFDTVIVKIKGFGYQKEAVIRSLVRCGVLPAQIIEVTPEVHNGCRKKKARRI